MTLKDWTKKENKPIRTKINMLDFHQITIGVVVCKDLAAMNTSQEDGMNRVMVGMIHILIKIVIGLVENLKEGILKENMGNIPKMGALYILEIPNQ